MHLDSLLLSLRILPISKRRRRRRRRLNDYHNDNHLSIIHRNIGLNLPLSSSSLIIIISLLLSSLFINQIDCMTPTTKSKSTTEWIEFEAAFQGECHISNPCQQLCFDLHDGTFECACQDGYHLHMNGYSCIAMIDIKNHSFQLFSSSSSLKTLKQIQSSNIVLNQTTKSLPLSTPSSSTTTTPTTKIPQSYHDINNDPISKSSIDNIIDPSSLYSCNDIECEAGGVCIETMPLSQNPQSSIQMNNIDYHHHHHQQQQQQQRQQHQKVRCKCPLGRGGQFCEKIIEVKQPHFMGSSYLALPTLRNAHRSLKINIEFKPESYDGVLLYSGQETNLDGDFIAIILIQGFIEFRFDCGMGEGIIRSDMPIILNSWNTIDIYRDGRNAWMQLNQGQQIFGHSKGLFSRITFRLETFLGGSPNISQIVNRINVNKGLIGCVRQLMINDRQYDLYNDTIDGIDIDQCNSDACNHVTCLNGGHCTVNENNDKQCICLLGYTGEYCEQQIEFSIPSFNGSSYLQFIGFGDQSTMFSEILIIIKPYKQDGLFLYNGERMDKTGDFISLNLVDGYVEFRFDLGTGAAILRSPEKITMKEWHTIYATRTGREGLLRVDDQPIAHGQSLGAFTQLTLPLNLYIGGVTSLNAIHHNVLANRLYHGCIQKIIINGHQLSLLEDVLSGVNIDNCQHTCHMIRPCQNNGHCEPIKHHYHCHCSTNLNFIGQHCEIKLNTGSESSSPSQSSSSYPMFYGNSFLRYSNPIILNRIRGLKTIIHLNLRAFSSSGLILWFGESSSWRKNRDYLTIGLNDGHINVDLNLDINNKRGHNLNSKRFIVNNTRIDDGQWHRLNVIRIGQQIIIHIDDNITVRGLIDGDEHDHHDNNNNNNVQSALYLGGLENTAMIFGNNNYEKGFIGCISNMTIDENFTINLMSDSDRGVNIRTCI
ncbi:pikachurin-like protein [Dermatophagoides farinae]|uniref:Pikachurin-like protein n=1 Tax=Dermatophagoides farinae TaxID=6954 RepID=A0A9D4SFS7_DERFA|nr:pikachurin-like [Dermatophagoides farinae]KAH7640417.1 pikachurin-like protein [Dermatophagoides farinae]